MRKKIKERYHSKRAVAIVLSLALVGSCLMGCGQSQEVSIQESVAEEENNQEDELLEAMQVSSNSNLEAGKEETVYLFADNTGKVNSTIVSAWLKNPEAEQSIQDVTNLIGVTNINGEETFSQNGEEYTWQANGNDIYYQGTTEKQAPITENITYYLDGKEISPDELAGKSGHVTIRFDYTNNETVTSMINGKEEKVYVPFAVVTGMILNSNFRNIEVENGRIISDGKNNIIVGFALPGLKESLHLDEMDTENLDLDEDLEVPDYVEVSADVRNFSLDMTLTVATSSSDFSFEDALDFSDLDEKIDTLSDSSTQLADGTGDLADGVQTLKHNLGEFADGVASLKDGLFDYTDGVAQVADGANELKDGASLLDDGAQELVKGISQVDDGAGQLADGINQVDDGAGQLADGINQVDDGAGKLVDGIGQVANGASQMEAGINGESGAKAGANALASAATQVKDGVEQLAAGTSTLKAGAEQVNSGANALAAGASEVNDGAAALAAGSNSLKSGADNLAAGANSAAAGAQQVAAGVSQLPSQLQSSMQAQVEGMKSQLNTSAMAVLTQAGCSSVEELAQKVSALQNGISQEMAALVDSDDDTVKQTLQAQITTQMQQLVALSQAQGALSSIQSVEGQLDGAGSMSEEQLQQLQTLVDGAAAVASGVQQVADGANNLAAGAAQVDTGAQNLAAGTNSLKDGADSLAAGSSSLTTGAEQVNIGASTLADGTSQLETGANALAAGISQLGTGASALVEGINQLSSGGQDLKNGTSQLKDGSSTLKNGISQLKDGSSTLKDGTSQLKNGGSSLKEGTAKLADGAGTLLDGASELNGHSAELKDGAEELHDGTGKIVDGVDELNDGAGTLLDGMLKFDEEGIKMIAEAYNEDVKSLTDRVKAISEAGEGYDNFTGKAENTKTSVKFILKTEAIK